MIRVLDLQPDQIKTLADLEKEIHRQIGVRVVIRRPGNIHITNTKAVAALLNRDLDIRAEGLKIAQFRDGSSILSYCSFS